MKIAISANFGVSGAWGGGQALEVPELAETRFLVEMYLFLERVNSGVFGHGTSALCPKTLEMIRGEDPGWRSTSDENHGFGKLRRLQCLGREVG